MIYLNLITPKKIPRQLLFNLLLLILLAYFIFHTIYGDRGIIAYFRLSQQLERTRSTLEESVLKRIELEHQAKLLRLGDKDFLDEKARNILGVASKREQIFSTTKQ